MIIIITPGSLQVKHSQEETVGAEPAPGDQSKPYLTK